MIEQLSHLTLKPLLVRVSALLQRGEGRGVGARAEESEAHRDRANRFVSSACPACPDQTLSKIKHLFSVYTIALEAHWV